MNGDLIRIATKLAYAGMPAHVQEQRTMQRAHVKGANADFADTCVYIASQILEIVEKKKENGHGQG
jgi:hypothetical protein